MIYKIRVRTNNSNAIRVYRLEGIGLKDAKILAEKLLSEPINQKHTINLPIVTEKVVEIAYKPGVMNPEVASIMKAAQDLGINLKAADSSTEYILDGKIPKYNPLTEVEVLEEPTTLLIKAKPGKIHTIPIRKMNDEQLMETSKDKLFLSFSEMQTIQKYFKKIDRDPTDLELETLAQTWSEHSGHKTFKSKLEVDGKIKKPLIQRIKEEALRHKENIVSAFSDNSGVMDFYEGYGICGKVETHNAPSAIEPYGGAMTGSGGVFRDIAATGKGAKNVASTDIFCFAPLNFPEKELPQGTLPPEYLLTRVVYGVRDYGNRMGIPTNNGSVHFYPDYRARPSVIVGAYGIVPKKYALKEEPKIGDLIVSVGGRTGRDGIHGATFSSGEMTEKTYQVNSQAVQIGNAIEEKRMFDALLEARDKDLIRLVQDVGGGGFSSAIGEIGENLGVNINLEKALLKYEGLAPWEIWISESQERMIIVLDPKNLKAFEEICKKYNADAVVLGKFDGSKKLRVYFDKQQISDLDMEFLHHGLPKRVLRTSSKFQMPSTKQKEPNTPRNEKEWISVLVKVLAHGNVCSKEPIVRLYDHSVQGTNDLQPYAGVNLDGPSDSPVLRLFLDKPYGMVISHGINGVLNKIDPYWGSIWAATEGLSNFVAVGGDYKNASLINNYIWPFPDEESLWSLDRSVDAVCDFMRAVNLPVISGKDSLSSTYRSSKGEVIKIPPTLCISVLGKIEDATKTVTADFKKVDSTIVLVGKVDESLGGSVYYDVNGVLGNDLPKVDLKVLPKVFGAIYKGIKSGKILSCHDVSEGGIISAIFEMCVGGNCGVKINLADNFLFNETAGCFIAEVENEKIAKEVFKDIPYKVLGKTQQETTLDVENVFRTDINELKKTWQEPMRRMFT